MTQAAPQHSPQLDSGEAIGRLSIAPSNPGNDDLQHDVAAAPPRASRVWWMATGLLIIMAVLRSLGLFVQRNFLTEKVLDEHVVNISGTFARLLQNSASRQRVIARVRALVPQVLEVLRDAEIKKFLNGQIEDMIRDTDLARATARVLRALTANQMHETLLDEFLGQLQRFFRSNQLWFRQQLREASPWFVPEMVDRKIFDSIMRKTEETLNEALTRC